MHLWALPVTLLVPEDFKAEGCRVSWWVAKLGWGHSCGRILWVSCKPGIYTCLKSSAASIVRDWLASWSSRVVLFMEKFIFRVSTRRRGNRGGCRWGNGGLLRLVMLRLGWLNNDWWCLICDRYRRGSRGLGLGEVLHNLREVLLALGVDDGS
jgi:hypothetical protein